MSILFLFFVLGLVAMLILAFLAGRWYEREHFWGIADDVAASQQRWYEGRNADVLRLDSNGPWAYEENDDV